MQDWLDLTERINVLDRFPGKAGKGDAFPLPEARERADRFDLRGRRVVFVGKNVARVFRCRADYLDTHTHRGAVATVIPHPSGVNRWYNDPGNCRKLSVFLRTLLAAS